MYRNHHKNLNKRIMEETINRICTLCKMGVMMHHPDVLSAYEGLYKCYTCGFTAKLGKRTSERLVNNGSPKNQ
jgi:hypothetical protein